MKSLIFARSICYANGGKSSEQNVSVPYWKEEFVGRVDKVIELSCEELKVFFNVAKQAR